MSENIKQTIEEYLDLKSQLIAKFKEIKSQEYKYDTLNLGSYDGWYELCEVELEIYDNLKFVYEDQDRDEEDIVNLSVERAYGRIIMYAVCKNGKCGQTYLIEDVIKGRKEKDFLRDIEATKGYRCEKCGGVVVEMDGSVMLSGVPNVYTCVSAEDLEAQKERDLTREIECRINEILNEKTVDDFLDVIHYEFWEEERESVLKMTLKEFLKEWASDGL